MPWRSDENMNIQMHVYCWCCIWFYLIIDYCCEIAGGLDTFNTFELILTLTGLLNVLHNTYISWLIYTNSSLFLHLQQMYGFAKIKFTYTYLNWADQGRNNTNQWWPWENKTNNQIRSWEVAVGFSINNIRSNPRCNHNCTWLLFYHYLQM